MLPQFDNVIDYLRRIVRDPATQPTNPEEEEIEQMMTESYLRVCGMFKLPLSQVLLWALPTRVDTAQHLIDIYEYEDFNDD